MAMGPCHARAGYGPPGRQGCARGSGDSPHLMPGAGSSVCASHAAREAWHCCPPPKCVAASEPGMAIPGNGDQVVAVPWQGPFRFPRRGCCQCHPRPGTSHSGGSTFPLCPVERYPSCLVPIWPWSLVQARPRMAEPMGRTRPRGWWGMLPAPPGRGSGVGTAGTRVVCALERLAGALTYWG